MSYGPQGGKGEGKGGKGGKGKGFQGNCYACGEFGHSAKFCPKTVATVEIEEENPAEQCNVESVWRVSAVWKEVGPSRNQRRRHNKKFAKNFLSESFSGSREANCGCQNGPCSEKLAEKIFVTQGNRYESLVEDDEEISDEQAEVNEIGAKTLTRQAVMEFAEADVRKPLASARHATKAGNGIWLEANGGYIQNLATGEKMEVRVENDARAFDIMVDGQIEDTAALDSGAGVSVWPRGRKAGRSVLLPKKKGIGTAAAAGGTNIEHSCHRQVCFKGVKAGMLVFARQA